MNNRIIKFRAWDKANNKMEYNVMPIVLNHDNKDLQCAITSLDIEEYDEGSMSLMGADYIECEPMQYTGLKDKNSEEIYEGDIVKISDWRWGDMVSGVVEFDELTYKLKSLNRDGFQEYWDDGEHEWYSLEQLYGDQFEVIGNKFENPELLNNL